MNLIVSRFGTHAFFQFDRVIKNHTIVLINHEGKTMYKYLLHNKDFLLVDNIKSNENYTVTIKNSHDEIIARKKI